MKHINQVEVKIPKETAEFLENVLDREERCVSAGGLATDVGLLRATGFPAESKFYRPAGDHRQVALRAGAGRSQRRGG